MMSDSNLVEYSREHLKYEIEMLLCTTDFAVPEQPSETKEQWVHRMSMIESWLIHLRNLIEFFSPLYIRHNDIRVIHFLPENNINQSLVERSERLKNAKKRIDEELAHLTYKRQFGTPESKRWELDILNDLVIIMIDFSDKSDSNKLALETKQIIEQFAEKIKSNLYTGKNIGYTGPSKPR